MRWCFDTSALIEPWVRLYPYDLMRPVWDKLQALAQDGTIRAPKEVLLELERQKDDLFTWARANDVMFVEPDRQHVERMSEIINTHQGLIKPASTKSAGDPWVIALAEIEAVPVVQYEARAKKGAAPRIPNICDERGIRCVTLVDVLRAEGFKL